MDQSLPSVQNVSSLSSLSSCNEGPNALPPAPIRKRVQRCPVEVTAKERVLNDLTHCEQKFKAFLDQYWTKLKGQPENW